MRQKMRWIYIARVVLMVYLGRARVRRAVVKDDDLINGEDG